MSNEVILAKRTFCSDIQVEQKISTRHSTMTWITEIFSFKLLYVFWLMWYTGRNSNHRESSSSSKARLHEPFFNMWFSFWMCIFECNNSVFLFFLSGKSKLNAKNEVLKYQCMRLNAQLNRMCLKMCLSSYICFSRPCSLS